MKTETGWGVTNSLAAWRRANDPKEAHVSHILRNSYVTPESQKAEEWAEPGISGGAGKAGSKTVGLTEVFVMVNLTSYSQAFLSSEDTKWLISGELEPESIQI